MPKIIWLLLSYLGIWSYSSIKELVSEVKKETVLKDEL